MLTLRQFLGRWAPPLLLMAAIFLASATPSFVIPRFGSLDYMVKKTGHTLAYALLALLLRRALADARRRDGVAWVLALLYAALDEFHQSFIPGRHPSAVDVLVFDGGGATAALLLEWILPRTPLRALTRAANRA